MKVVAEDGDIKEFEKPLDEYGLMVQGQKAPEDFFETALQVSEYKHKAEMCAMEVRQKQELLRLQEKHYEKRIETLEETQKNLSGHINIITNQSFQNLTRTIRELAAHTQDNTSDSLVSLEKILSTLLKDSDKEKVIVTVNNIQKKDPNIITKLFKSIALPVVTGSAGNSLWKWLEECRIILKHKTRARHQTRKVNHMDNIDIPEMHQLMKSFSRFSSECRRIRENPESSPLCDLERLEKNLIAIQIKIHDLQIKDSPHYQYFRNKQN